ncbi:Uncharacterised protein [Vibrio cholerae]|nr:Uncharacterised protein [Vibrio cholerae]
MRWPCTISSVIPVNSVISSGIGLPGSSYKLITSTIDTIR